MTILRTSKRSFILQSIYVIENYKILTVTHQHLNVEDIAQFTVQQADLTSKSDVLRFLAEELKVEEIIYLSTCNRVSYIFCSQTEIDDDYIAHFFASINPNISQNILNALPKYVQLFEGLAAVEHLFKVAASMESLVIGEREIFRQFRQAYTASETAGFIKDDLRILENHVVKTAKRVYAKTAIGENPVSVVSLAIKKFLATQPSMDSRIVLIGAGETNTLVGKFLSKYKFKNISIFNRSLDNAQNLREMLNAKAYHLSELQEFKQGFDSIFICTAAVKPIIDQNLYRSLLNRESDKKTIIDLSVPHNVDKQVMVQNDIDFIDIEQLRKLAEENLNLRKSELSQAKLIVDLCLKTFGQAYQQRQIEKMLRFIPKEVEQIKSHALNNVYKDKIDNLDPQAQALVQEMMDYMAKKCVAAPMKLAKC